MSQNTGNTQEKKGSEVSIDWLQFTISHELAPRDVLPDRPCFDVVGQTRPLRQYSHALVLACGGVVNIAEHRPEHMGVNLLFTGSNLRSIRESGVTDDEIAVWSTSIARKFSRVDIALDVPFQMQPRKVEFDYRKGKIITKMKLHSLYEMSDEQGGGGGVYFGGTKSHRRVVVYDKAKEMKLLSEALTRVEMRCRNNQASQVMRVMKDLGREGGIRQIMKKYFNYGSTWFQDAIGDLESIELPKPEKPTDKWREWILGDVVKSCEKRQDTHQETIKAVIDRLEALVL